MKAIIAGGRDFIPEQKHFMFVDRVFNDYPITEIVSGGCSGADKFGENYARRYQLKLTTFTASWNKYGKKAGPIRNEEMAAYADIVISFPGGRGTADMERRAMAHSLKIIKYKQLTTASTSYDEASVNV